MYAVFEFRLSQRNTAEVNIGVFRRSCCASQRRSLKDVVRLALLEERPATSANGLRVQQDEKRLSLWFRERIRRISRSSAPSGVSLYLLSNGCRYSYTNAHYTSFLILLSSPSGSPLYLLFRHIRFLNVRFFISCLPLVLFPGRFRPPVAFS